MAWQGGFGVTLVLPWDVHYRTVTFVFALPVLCSRTILYILSLATSIHMWKLIDLSVPHSTATVGHR